MKNILVSTDFSENAHAAVVFAAALARRFQARLIILHAYHPGILLEEVSIWADPDKLEQEVQERMDQLAREIHTNYGLSVTRLLKPGFAVMENLSVAGRVKADLMVLGTIGAGNHRTGNLGKVASELISKATQPLICVSPETCLPTADAFGIQPEQVLAGNEAGLKAIREVFLAPATAFPSDPATVTPAETGEELAAAE